MRTNDRSKTDFDRAKIKLTGHFDRRPTGRYFEPWLSLTENESELSNCFSINEQVSNRKRAVNFWILHNCINLASCDVIAGSSTNGQSKMVPNMVFQRKFDEGFLGRRCSIGNDIIFGITRWPSVINKDTLKHVVQWYFVLIFRQHVIRGEHSYLHINVVFRKFTHTSNKAVFVPNEATWTEFLLPTFLARPPRERLACPPRENSLLAWW